MSKRAADKMWNRATQIRGVANRIASTGRRADIDTYVAELRTIADAMRQDGNEEYAHGQEWYREQERKAKVRREQERIRPAGPKVEEAL